MKLSQDLKFQRHGIPVCRVVDNDNNIVGIGRLVSVCDQQRMPLDVPELKLETLDLYSVGYNRRLDCPAEGIIDINGRVVQDIGYIFSLSQSKYYLFTLSSMTCTFIGGEPDVYKTILGIIASGSVKIANILVDVDSLVVMDFNQLNRALGADDLFAKSQRALYCSLGQYDWDSDKKYFTLKPESYQTQFLYLGEYAQPCLVEMENNCSVQYISCPRVLIGLLSLAFRYSDIKQVALPQLYLHKNNSKITYHLSDDYKGWNVTPSKASGIVLNMIGQQDTIFTSSIIPLMNWLYLQDCDNIQFNVDSRNTVTTAYEDAQDIMNVTLDNVSSSYICASSASPDINCYLHQSATSAIDLTYVHSLSYFTPRTVLNFKSCNDIPPRIHLFYKAKGKHSNLRYALYLNIPTVLADADTIRALILHLLDTGFRFESNVPLRLAIYYGDGISTCFTLKAFRNMLQPLCRQNVILEK